MRERGKAKGVREKNAKNERREEKCVRKKRDWGGERKDLRHERGEDKFTRNKREIRGK